MSHSNAPFSWDELSFSEVDEHLAENQRWSTWDSVERLCHGPKPWPYWLVTSSAAIDTEFGVLKTGKEADVFLIERAVPGDPDQACLLAAKRYRTADHRLFRRDNAYTAGRRVRNSRDGRAIAGKTEFGRGVEADLWAQAEWFGLKLLFEAGVPVPYPVQLDGREILMEFICDADAGATVAAPRLHQVRLGTDQLAALFDQLLGALRTMARLGVVHGDLSPYNTLVADADSLNPRLVIIDVPQLVDLAANPYAVEFLQRDCANMAQWFTTKGQAVDADELLADLLGHAW
ncbi:MAG TPA: RIO1 family regulatory kinase/ATPase [Propionicimonas sp.]|uniref:serine protein kinase RIO n=1 Tax=Propionicimonas sp. TaxID=1955623 RepID=UPI002F403ABE